MAEQDYARSSYNFGYNSPVVVNDPRWDCPFCIVGLIALGGGIINTATNFGNINSFAEGLNYFTTGAVGYTVGITNPVAGGLILAGGNLTNRAINGDLSITSVDDVFGEATTVLGDFLGPFIVGNTFSTKWTAFNPTGNIPKSELLQVAKEGVVPSTDIVAGTGLRKTVTGQMVKNVGAQTSKQIVNQVEKGSIQLSKTRFGHTFIRHGEDATNFLINRARGSGMAQGQFLNNQKTAQFILDNVEKTANGAVNLPIPKGFPARIINPNGTFSPATHIRLVPGGGGIKTAYPFRL